MNSFDLVKFRNQLLTENISDEIDYEDENFSDPFIDGDLDEGTLEENNSPEYLKGYGDGYTDGYHAGEQGIEPEVEINEGTLDEMAKIAGDLKTAIEKVIASNGDLEGLALKKAIKSDADVQNALAGDDLYDNQLNKFIALSKGEREIGQRGRKVDPNKPTKQPTTSPKTPKSPKLKITNPTPKSNSTKLADLTPSDVFTGMDDEEMDMEKQAMKAAKGNKRLGTAVEKLAQVTQEMKALAKEYQASKGTPEEAGIIAQLKDLTAEKKALEKKTATKQMTAADLMGGEDL